MGAFCSAPCLEVVDRPLIFVACFAQLLDMLLRDVLFALWSSFKQLKPRGLAVLELPFAAPFLSLKIFDKIHDDRLRAPLDPCVLARITTAWQQYSNSFDEYNERVIR